MEKVKGNAFRLVKHSFVTCLILMNLVSACSKEEGPVAAPQSIDDKTRSSNVDGESQEGTNLVAGAAVKIMVMAGPVVNGVVKSVTGDIIATTIIGGGVTAVSGGLGGVDAAKKTAIGLLDYHNIPIAGDAASICEFVYHFGGWAIDQEKANQCEDEYLRRLAQSQQVNNAIPQDEKEQRRKDTCTGLIDNMTLAIKGMQDNQNLLRLDEACTNWSQTLANTKCTAADAAAGTFPPALDDASAEDRQKFMELKAKLAGKCLSLTCVPGKSDIRCTTNNGFKK